MPEVKTYVCEHCGYQRGFADHWLIAERKRGAFMVYTWEAGIKLPGKREYFCGQSCLLAELVEHLHRSAFPAAQRRAIGSVSPPDPASETSVPSSKA